MPWSARARLLSRICLSGGSFVHDPLALAANPDLTAVAEDLVTNARLRAALGTHELHVARVKRGLALHDAALDVLVRVRLRVALDHVHAFDHEAIGLGRHFEDAPTLAAVFAR